MSAFRGRPARPVTDRARLEVVPRLAVAAVLGLVIGAALHPATRTETARPEEVFATVDVVGAVLDPDPVQLLEVEVHDTGSDPVRVTALSVTVPGEPPVATPVNVEVPAKGVRVLTGRTPSACSARAQPWTVSVMVASGGAPARQVLAQPVRAAQRPCLDAAAVLPAGSAGRVVEGTLTPAVVPDVTASPRLTASGLPPGPVAALRAGPWALVPQEPAEISADGRADVALVRIDPPCLIDPTLWRSVPTGVELTSADGRQAYLAVGPGLAGWLLRTAQACP